MTLLGSMRRISKTMVYACWLKASTKVESILCSVLLTKTDIEAELLTLTTGVAAAEAITTHCKIRTRAKSGRDTGRKTKYK
ncbi:MAG: hypothetical protein ACYS8S_06820 [Planctomycetota bacterium]